MRSHCRLHVLHQEYNVQAIRHSMPLVQRLPIWQVLHVSLRSLLTCRVFCRPDFDDKEEVNLAQESRHSKATSRKVLLSNGATRKRFGLLRAAGDGGGAIGVCHFFLLIFVNKTFIENEC